MTREDKKFANNLNYDGVQFPVREKDFSKIGKNNYICINVFCYENKLAFSIYVSNQKFENSMYLLIIIDGDNSHYVYITDLCFTKQRIKKKYAFGKVVFSVLLVKLSCQNIKKFV